MEINFIETCNTGRIVAWHGGSQVNLFLNDGIGWMEVSVSSRAKWWETRPTLQQVADHAEHLFCEHWEY